MGQILHRGDLVKVADDLGPSMSHFEGNGEEALVIGSYRDQYGGRDSENPKYTLLFRDHGRVSWYYQSQLTLIRHAGEAEIHAWQDALNKRNDEQFDLTWIVTHWAERKDDLPGASCEALMKLCGIDNPWGSHGEGFVWYQNAMITIAVLRNALDSGDVEQVKTRAAEIRQARRG